MFFFRIQEKLSYMLGNDRLAAVTAAGFYGEYAVVSVSRNCMAGNQCFWLCSFCFIMRIVRKWMKRRFWFRMNESRRSDGWKKVEKNPGLRLTI